MKKIYYFPGLISAVLIPLLFWYYGNRKFEEINFTVMDIWLPPKTKPGEKTSFLSFEPYRNWNYKKIKVPSNKAKENTKLYVTEIKNLQRRNEKNSGIEFILDDSNTYNDLIALFNDIELAGQIAHTLDAEKTWHFFVPHHYINPNIQELDASSFTRCGTGLIDNYIPNNKWLKGFQVFESQLTQLPKESFYIMFGFLFLVNISMFSIKERFQMSIK
ncbi:hypothetical protein [Chryseobacterium shigense]|uniref:Uncharacterized protein n=1 Tax=Chryseobacterium shigense TaxID=297244 RepID=A0A841N3I9_9FLAO|nr:hypothetical protein [Chryseobacterium shigense]MBB6369301.1 hypothetical protein [Chryseobacterium shigense]